jgi:hypothetical protein
MTTFLDILTEIKDILLESITAFDQGYAYARLDPNLGLVVTQGNEAHYVGITDVEGDYFYIRVPHAVNGPYPNAISSMSAKSKQDCSVAITQKCPCALVAVVKDADEFKLSDALVNELLKTKVIEVKAVWIDPVIIVEQEFKGLDAAALNAVKARIGDRTLVRIDFDITRNFETHNCNYQICKPC